MRTSKKRINLLSKEVDYYEKNICKILACGLIFGTSVTGAHAEEALLISPAPAAYTVTVGGSALKLNGKAMFVSNKHIMVPLRSVAESLGFKVSWNGEKQGITLDDGEENKITYRTEQTIEDISGDYNEYETEETEEINGLSITLKGDGGKYYTAIWNDGEFSYALSTDNELKKKIFIKIILEIR